MLYPGVISAESDELMMNVTFSFQFMLSYTTVAKKENVIRLMKKRAVFYSENHSLTLSLNPKPFIKKPVHRK